MECGWDECGEASMRKMDVVVDVKKPLLRFAGGVGFS